MDSNFIKSYPNFLPQPTFKRLQKYVLGGNFPWWYTKTDHNPDDLSIQEISKIKGAINWKPLVKVDEGIVKIVKSIKDAQK